MSQQGETKFKVKVVKELKAAFGDSIKITKIQQRTQIGVLDLMICLFGDYIEIELKVDGQIPTPLQKINIDRTLRSGGYAFYTTPLQWNHHLAVIKEKYEHALKRE